jgi:uncharacterized protein YjbI with pentapeptide repeats
MANEEQLAILKQGVNVWNKWRKDNPRKGVDLTKADLFSAHLAGADLHDANLMKAYLTGANLKEAHLISTNLFNAHLVGANLSHANLNEANLSRANLEEVIFVGTHLDGSEFSDAILGATVFSSDNLSRIIGIENIRHRASSTIGTDTLQLSKGKIPAAFLRGCGLSDLDIEYAKLYNPDLSNQEITDITYRIYDLRAHQSIQISPLFISYSHTDAAFVDRLEVAINEKGIRFWRDIHHATSGRLERQIEQAIRHNPTVLLVLSANAIESDWVQHEVRKARGLEKELGRDVLCPVALDGSWKDCGWPERVMEQVMEYNVLDFSKWQDDGVFRQMFDRLLDGLQLFYKG